MVSLLVASIDALRSWMALSALPRRCNPNLGALQGVLDFRDQLLVAEHDPLPFTGWSPEPGKRNTTTPEVLQSGSFACWKTSRNSADVSNPVSDVFYIENWPSSPPKEGSGPTQCAAAKNLYFYYFLSCAVVALLSSGHASPINTAPPYPFSGRWR